MFSLCHVLAIATALFMVACGAEETRPRLVLVVATCSLNANYLGAYNSDITTTPFLDKLAEKSLVFDKHYTEAGQSGVAFASIFSGGHADQHGIFYHPSRPRDELVWLPEVFAEAGYETYSWLAHPNASTRLNYAQGVVPERQRGNLAGGSGREFDEILSEMLLHPERKVMMLSNFAVTHRPYGGGTSAQDFCKAFPDECGTKLADPEFWKDKQRLHQDPRRFSYDTQNAMERAGLRPEDINRFRENIELLYRADVFLLDRIMAGIFSAIERHGLLEESLIIFTADHGETMHPSAVFPWTHGFQLTPEVLRVPLMIYGPGSGVAAGRVDEVTRSIDVLPTVSGLAGINAEGENIVGVDLSAPIRTDEPLPRLTAHSHTSLWADSIWKEYSEYARFSARFPTRDPEAMWVSAVSGNLFYRLHRDSRGDWQREAFDLEDDPFAVRDTFDEKDSEQQAMFVELKGYHDRLVRAYREGSDGAPMAPIEEEQILRALGYIE